MITQNIRNSITRLFESYNLKEFHQHTNNLFYIKYGNLINDDDNDYIIITISLTKSYRFKLSESINDSKSKITYFTTKTNLFSHLLKIYPNTIFYPASHHSHEKSRFEDLRNLNLINKKITHIKANPQKFLANMDDILNNIDASLQEIQNNIKLRHQMDTDELDLISQEIEELTSF